MEDTDLVFNAGHFGFSDPLDSDSLANVIIAAAPSNGTLYDDVNSNGTIDGGETVHGDRCGDRPYGYRGGPA